MARQNVIRLARAALSAHLPRGSSSPVRHTLLYTRFSCYKCAVRGDETRRLFVLQVNESLCSGGCREYNTAACNQTRPLLHSYSRGANERGWLKFGLSRPDFGRTRFIHATAHMSGRDFYDVLGISKNATASEIKKAYLGLAKQLHPDVNKDDPEAAKKFQEVQKAYEVLKDEEKRQTYDQVGHDAFNSAEEHGGAGPGFSGFPGFEDIFKNADIFNMFRQKMGGDDVKLSVELSFMDAVQGCSKTVAFQTELPCGACGGSGVPPGTRPETCRRCKGSGMVFQQTGLFTVQATCPQCRGSGKIVSSFCKTCKGGRVVRGTKTVKLDIMPGVDNDEILKVYRSGGADPDGNQPGDLYVTIKVREDPVFRRERSDIHVDAVLTITQAILGGTVQVPTLTGDVVVKVRPGTQPGQKVVLKKKGIKARNSYSFGDQFVHFKVSIPMNLTQRQRQLIEEFARDEQGEDDKDAAAGASS
nr:chaperone protein DnaJ GFA2, mitochondrial [Ipomoea batatas]